MDSRHSGILSYVKKSKLVEKLKGFEPSAYQAELDELLRAIELGDSRASIFSHLDCSLFLTYLAAASEISHAENKISSDTFLQTSLYLAFVQFQEQDIKGVVLSQAENAKEYGGCIFQYEDVLRKYLNKLKGNLYSFNVEQAYAFYQQLTGIDQFLMLQDVTSMKNDPLGKLLVTSVGSAFFVTLVPISSDTSLYVIPSIRFLKWLATHLNPENQFKLAPIYGAIKADTLFRDFHLSLLRPVSLYSNDVKSSLTRVHNKQATSLTIMLHDIYYHYMVVSLIPSDIVHFLFEVAGVLAERKEKASNLNAKVFFGAMLDHWSDFELNSFVNFSPSPSNQYRSGFFHTPLTFSNVALNKLVGLVFLSIKEGMDALNGIEQDFIARELDLLFLDMLKIKVKLRFEIEALVEDVRKKSIELEQVKQKPTKEVPNIQLSSRP